MSTAIVTTSHEVLEAHARSFSLAARFLPRDRRDDAAIVYALCRLIDDTADEAPDPETAATDLEQLRREVSGAVTARPLVSAALDVLARGGLDAQPVHDLLDGVIGDLGPVEVADDRALLRYGYRVAGTVGLMMCAVLGVEDRRALPFAIDLGIGMQITNICRDVLEDAQRGRVYVPADRLALAGTSSAAVLSGTADRAAVATVVRDLLDLADGYYDSAARGMRFIPARSRLAILVASRVYRGIGGVLRNRGCDPMDGRVWTHPLQKGAAAFIALGDFATTIVGSEPVHDPQLHTALDGFAGAS